MLTGQVGTRASILSCATLSLLLLLSSCNNSGTDNPANSFSGITRADSTGALLSSDPSDWAPIPAVGLEFLPKGAYPNPSKAGKGFNLGWHTTQTDSIVITINDSPTHVINTVGAWLEVPGSYVVNYPMSGLQAGIYRVYFKVVRHDSTYVTYGDVQLSN